MSMMSSTLGIEEGCDVACDVACAVPGTPVEVAAPCERDDMVRVSVAESHCSLVAASEVRVEVRGIGQGVPHGGAGSTRAPSMIRFRSAEVDKRGVGVVGDGERGSGPDGARGGADAGHGTGFGGVVAVDSITANCCNLASSCDRRSR